MSNEAYFRLLQACTKAVSDPGAYIESWKARRPGGRVIGFFPTYVPTELIIAAGALPVGMWGGPVSVSRANSYIQQFTCSILRSTTEYALKGSFNVLDGALFPPMCDAVKMISSSWNLNFSDRFYIDMVNLPERLDSGATVAYLTAELGRVGDVLSQLCGRPITDDALRQAITACNRVRSLQQALYRWRNTPAGARATLSEVSTILKAGTVMDAEEYAATLEAFLGASSDQEGGEAKTSAVPVVVTGLPCQLPHANFLDLFESSGLRVVNDDLFLGMRACGEIATAGDPYENIARGFVDSAALSTRYHSKKPRHELVLEQVRDGKAKGVVFLIPKFCEAEWFDLRYLKQELEQRSIPSISLDFEEDPGGVGPVQTRLEAFAETLA